MCKLSEDEEAMVRSEVMGHIPAIALFCKDHCAGLKTVIRQQLVPYTVKLLTDDQLQVRVVGQSSLLVLLENNLIDNSQLSEWICPLISQLATSESNNEELRVEDVTVMCKMIPHVGREITVKMFLEPFVSLCCSSTFTFRKVCALNFGQISKVVGTELTELNLLPSFLNLANDEVWGVRKACADVFVDVASVINIQTRKEVLSHIFINLLSDNSRFVKNAAYRSLGGFISTFADPLKSGMKYENGSCIHLCMENGTGEHLDSLGESEKENENKSLNNSNNNSHQGEVKTDDSVTEKSNLEASANNCFDSNVINQNNSSEKSKETLNNTDVNTDTQDTCILNSNSIRTGKVACHFVQTVHNDLGNKPDKDSYKTDEKETDDVFRNKTNEMNLSSSLEEKDIKKMNSSCAADAVQADIISHHSNENVYNNFQFWRIPLPEIEINFEIESKVPTNSNNQCFGINRVCQKNLYKESIFTDGVNFDSSKSVISSRQSSLSRMKVEDTLAISNNSQNSIVDSAEQSWIASSLIQNSVEDLDELLRRKLTKKSSKSILKEMTVYDQDIVPPELLSRFIDAGDSSFLTRDINKHQEDEKAGFCAYSFPAVAYTLGRKYWPCVKTMYQKLARDLKWTVRGTIASCLHELAEILGKDIVVSDLLPIFLELLKDVDEVRIRIVSHLPDFLKHLDASERTQFLPLIEEFTKMDNDKNWRFRYAVAEQLKPTTDLYSASDVHEYFVPIALFLIQDRVSEVRQAAVELMAVIVKRLSEDKKTTEYTRVFLCMFDTQYRQASKWLWRQMYVLLCQQIAIKQAVPRDVFVEEIVPNLFSLAWDSVPNVRLAVSRCLSLTLLPLDYLPSIQKAHYELLLQVMCSLQSDVDKDVRHYAHLSAETFNVFPQKKLSPIDIAEKLAIF
ncbi:serine/threonine-protein phosphatase 4 regulatory subunit 1-like isoform X2 [Stegodyphus dumicola]|nr:serine/threonine-protein phosphatase 4 regulatory subunit 1-like isoform X2 [Stegodyphus dumicola]